jgi:hypothetical protein
MARLNRAIFQESYDAASLQTVMPDVVRMHAKHDIGIHRTGQTHERLPTTNGSRIKCGVTI